jgi:hypothetical protein
MEMPGIREFERVHLKLLQRTKGLSTFYKRFTS